MHFIQLFTTAASFAALATAVPRPSDGPDHEIRVFKRDAPLTAEDLVLAEMHQVNTTEMFKHSVIKRRGEEDVIIWVNHDFEEATGPHEDPSVDKRALKIIDGEWQPNSGGWHYDTCMASREHQTGDTGPGAPCTGGLKELRDWARRSPGQFLYNRAANNWRTLVAAGSNTGCNGRFRAQRMYAGVPGPVSIGNVNVQRLVGNTVNRYAHWYSGRQRARSYGDMECGPYFTPMNFQVTDWPDRV